MGIFACYLLTGTVRKRTIQGFQHFIRGTTRHRWFCGGPRMTFQIGDKVVYPNQGVGTIENISTRSFGAAFEKFYLLRLESNCMTVLVPFSHAANIGLRRVTKNREIARILSFLANGW